jgi:hypothetical protein
MTISRRRTIKQESMMIETPMSNQLIVKANASHAILASRTHASAWHTLPTAELSFTHPARAYSIMDYTSEHANGVNQLNQSWGTPCTESLLAINTTPNATADHQSRSAHKECDACIFQDYAPSHACRKSPNG